jgi:AcrR family transcriptional regulator
MAGDGPGDNPRRAYRSAVRAEAARRTRSAILAAAHETFVARGYGATSLRGIAQAAGVSVPTIEQTFGTKANLLKTVVDVTRAGDDQPIPVLERAPAQAALATTNAADFLTVITTEIGVVATRVSGIFIVVEQAAASDDQIRQLATELDTQRRAVAAWILDALRDRGRLRPGLDSEHAADTIWVLLDPTVHRRLTHHRGWTTETFTRWLRDAIIHLILAPDAQPDAADRP